MEIDTIENFQPFETYIKISDGLLQDINNGKISRVINDYLRQKNGLYGEAELRKRLKQLRSISNQKEYNLAKKIIKTKTFFPVTETSDSTTNNSIAISYIFTSKNGVKEVFNVNYVLQDDPAYEYDFSFYFSNDFDRILKEINDLPSPKNN